MTGRVAVSVPAWLLPDMPVGTVFVVRAHRDNPGIVSPKTVVLEARPEKAPARTERAR